MRFDVINRCGGRLNALGQRGGGIFYARDMCINALDVVEMLLLERGTCCWRSVVVWTSCWLTSFSSLISDLACTVCLRFFLR